VARRQLLGLRIVVTGASSGIGRELAWQLASRGAKVLATARREAKLKELVDSFAKSSQGNVSAGQIDFIAGDITDAIVRNSICDWCHEHWNALDVLINNAGAGAIGSFAEANPDRLRKVMELDFFAPVELTRVMLPLLQKGDRPAIMNIGSVLSHRAVPMKSEYCAAKFALRGWSESLRCELAPQKIDVLQISPSTTRSEFLGSLVDTNSNEKSRSIGSMSSKQVAKVAISGLVRSRRDIVLSLGGKGLVWAGRFFPGLMDRLLSSPV